ncbi:MAG: LysR family transcriptional regulator [Thiolinea sp.]
MNIRQLEAFRATMRAGSVTAAAEMLHISQPSVSRLLADLQHKLGFELFIRSGRGLVATVEARRFYQGVESLFMGTDRLQELADTIRSTAGDVVSLGAIQSVSNIALPRAVSQLYHERPDVRIMVYVRNTPAIIDAVQMQQFDLGIVGRAPPYEGVETLFETVLPYVCLMPETHHLADNAEIDLEALADSEQFVTFGGAYPDEMLDIDHDLSQRLLSHSRLSAANMPMAAALAREAGVLAIVDQLSAEAALQNGGMVACKLKQQLHYHLAIVTRGLDTLTAEARQLVNLLKTNLTAEIK